MCVYMCSRVNCHGESQRGVCVIAHVTCVVNELGLCWRDVILCLVFFFIIPPVVSSI